MPHFLHQIASSREGWQALVNSLQDRIEAVRPAVEKTRRQHPNSMVRFR